MKNYLLFILSVWIIGPHLHAQTLQGRILFEDNPKMSPGQCQGNLAWYAIFDHQFEMAEKSARHALVLDPNQVWVNTNLAHALLLQGKTDEGMNIYLQFRDLLTSDGRPFRGIFLNDIAEMEKAGIICAGFDEVEKLLKD